MTNDSVFTTKAIGRQAEQLFTLALEDEAVLGAYMELDAYNSQLAKHCSGVAMLASAFAIKLGLYHQHAARTVQLALLHDLGKIDVSNDLINKPGLYTDNERQEMKMHTLHGFERVSRILGPKEALPVLLHHRLQADPYPNDQLLHRIMKSYDLSMIDIDSDILQSLVCIVVADNYESRIPITGNTHAYRPRDYSLSDEKIEMNAEFMANGFLKKHGLVENFNIILDLGEIVSGQSIANTHTI
jgi:hypothetical protein